MYGILKLFVPFVTSILTELEIFMNVFSNHWYLQQCRKSEWNTVKECQRQCWMYIFWLWRIGNLEQDFFLAYRPSIHNFLVNTSIYKYWPISTKLGQNVYDHKILDEFDYWFNWTRTVRVSCPWICKKCWIFVYTLASTNIDQLVSDMVTIYMTMRSWMS